MSFKSRWNIINIAKRKKDYALRPAECCSFIAGGGCAALVLHGSRKVAKVALEMALTDDREQEREYKASFAREGIRTAAVDYGGDFISSFNKIIERAVVAAKREGVIREIHAEEGAVAGAAREAMSQIMHKALGLNIGGKIGIARHKDHITVAVFFGVGLLHLDEVAVGLGHRAVTSD